ncbi:AB24G protein, partial [Oreotrochilus melanogaster]|nr:AB24G protein [Oreotrochilus melanogaster]
SGPCEPGYYCTGGSMLPNPRDGIVGNICPQGHFCPPGSSSPSPCPAGSFLAHHGGQSAQDCQPCFPGWFCSQPAQSSPEECPAGFYCLPGTKAATQYPCPEGTYSNQTGLGNPRECKPCPGGTFCASAGLSSPSGPCFPGYYCTSKAQIPNPLHDEAGSICPEGHYCPPGSTKPQPCPTGTFLPQFGMVYPNACLPCPGGKFC